METQRKRSDRLLAKKLKSEARHNHELSAFKTVKDIVLLEILKLIDPPALNNLKMTGRFFLKFVRNNAKCLRTPTMNVIITVRSYYNLDKMDIRNRSLSHTLVIPESMKSFQPLKMPTDAINLYRNKTINLQFKDIRINIDLCVNISEYLWQIKATAEEVKFHKCTVKEDNKYPRAPAFYSYFSIILHQLAARTIVFHKSHSLSSLAHLFLNNSSMHRTERVFFSCSRVSLKWNNIHQMLIHQKNKKMVLEWRNEAFLPRSSWSREDESLNLLDWVQKNLEAFGSNPFWNPLDWSGYVKIDYAPKSSLIGEFKIDVSPKYLKIYCVRYRKPWADVPLG